MHKTCSLQESNPINDKRIHCQKTKGKNCRNFPSMQNWEEQEDNSTTTILKKITKGNKNVWISNSGGKKTKWGLSPSVTFLKLNYHKVAIGFLSFISRVAKASTKASFCSSATRFDRSQARLSLFMSPDCRDSIF